MLQYERYMHMSVSCVIIAQKTNNKAILALSSLIHALFEVESYAVARLVPKDGKERNIVLLAPSIAKEYECLLDVQLPFAEDVRSYKFPPLDRVVTVSGKIITEHRNLPTDDLKEAMSDYVDAMDLSDFGKDEDGYLPPSPVPGDSHTDFHQQPSRIHAPRRNLLPRPPPPRPSRPLSRCPSHATHSSSLRDPDTLLQAS